MEVGSGGKIKLLLTPPPFFFLLFLVQNSVCHFLNPNQTTACERRLGERWYVLVWGF